MYTKYRSHQRERNMIYETLDIFIDYIQYRVVHKVFTYNVCLEKGSDQLFVYRWID